MHLRKLVVLATLGIVALPAAAESQTQATQDSDAPAVVEALLQDIDMAEQKLVALGEAIPEEAWDWRPAEGVRSVREVLMHVAADNWFIPALADVPVPEQTGIVPDDYRSVQAYEARRLDRAETLAELRASFAHLDVAMRAIREDDLGATLNVFGQEMNGLQLWVLAATHLHEHLGQLIAYARMNDVVPPWSQQQ